MPLSFTIYPSPPNMFSLCDQEKFPSRFGWTTSSFGTCLVQGSRPIRRVSKCVFIWNSGSRTNNRQLASGGVKFCELAITDITATDLIFFGLAVRAVERHREEEHLAKSTWWPSLKCESEIYYTWIWKTKIRASLEERWPSKLGNLQRFGGR